MFDLDSHVAARDRPHDARRAPFPVAAARSPTRRGCCSARPRIPFAPPLEWRAQRLAKKIAAGAQFIQTQYCYDVPLLRDLHARRCEDLGLLDKVFILVGVGPLRSAKAAEWMRTHVPGMHIPDAVIKRLAGAGDQAREGRQLCIELIQEIREIQGVHGVHVMAYRQEDSVAEIIERSGVLDGRVPWYPGRDPQPTANRTAS